MFGNLLYWIYKTTNFRFIKNFCISLINRLEGGTFYSKTMRRILLDLHNVEIGMYTHGGCFNPGQFDRHTKIGRYCSIAATASAMNRNHPMEYKSSHAFFFNPILKYCKEDKIEYTPLEIGNDVWLGHNSIIVPNVKKIGDGAVVAAGAVVNKDVPPYAVVVGNPARPVRYRFTEEKIKKLIEEKWWEKSIEEIRNENFSDYIKPFIDGKE